MREAPDEETVMLDHLKHWREKYFALKTKLDKIQALVDKQAEDEGLWFEAVTAPEDYLQMALRELHKTIEGD